MLGTPLTPTPTDAWQRVVARVRRWSVESQQTARRNAMVATTACAQRRAERQDVADFIAARTAPEAHESDPAAAEADAHRAHG